MAARAAANPPDGGDISIDWIARRPRLLQPQDRRHQRWIWLRRPQHRPRDRVESLEGGDYECGDLAYFFAEIDVNDDPARVGTGASIVNLVTEFSKVTTSGGLVGFGELVGLPMVGSDTGHTGDGDEAVTSVSTASSSGTKLLVSLDVTGVEAAEEIIVRYTVRLVCGENPGQVTGNIQTAAVSANVKSGGSGRISLGAQVVPLKSANNIRGSQTATTLYREAGDADEQLADGAVISTGDQVYDTAQVAGIDSTATGTITYRVYAVDVPVAPDPAANPVCPGTVVFENTKPVAGSAPDSDPHTFNTGGVPFVSAGVFEWQAEYSGDAAHTGSRSVCGTETVDVRGPILGVTKTADAETVSAGDPIGFTITVTNSGGGTARNVVLTDTLPTGTGLNWSMDPAVPGCAIADGVLDCTFGDLAPDAIASVHVTSPTTAATCGTVANEPGASAEADNHDPDTSDPASVDVQCPNLSVIKAATPVGPVSAGDPIGFRITVSNGGAGTATNVTLTDTLPSNAGLSWAVSPAVAGCAIAGSPQVLTCAIGTLGPAASFSVTVTSPTTAATCGTVANDPGASAVADNNALVNSAVASVTVNCPDLVVDKTRTAAPISAGDDAGFTITVTNNGPGTATNVDPDRRPAGRRRLGATTAPAAPICTLDGTVDRPASLSCAFGDLADDAERQRHPDRRHRRGRLRHPRQHRRRPTPTTTTRSPTAPRSSSTARTSTSRRRPATARSAPARTPVFTITVTNNGAGTATDVTLTDNLPDGVDWSRQQRRSAPLPRTSARPARCSSCAFGDLRGQRAVCSASPSAA